MREIQSKPAWLAERQSGAALVVVAAPLLVPSREHDQASSKARAKSCLRDHHKHASKQGSGDNHKGLSLRGSIILPWRLAAG